MTSKQQRRRTSCCRSVLLLLLLAAASVNARVLHQQAQVVTDTPVRINAAAAAAAEPAVEATTGLVNKLAEKIHSKTALAAPPPAPAPAPIATIVLPAPQQPAALPTTTTGGITLATSTPVTLSSPINVTTPVSQKNFQHGGGKDVGTLLQGLQTLIAAANLAANAVGAAAGIAGSVPSWLDAFLPDCPPPVPGAPVIPGCEVTAASLVGGLLQPLQPLLGLLGR